jgi:hypothetical protein
MFVVSYKGVIFAAFFFQESADNWAKSHGISQYDYKIEYMSPTELAIALEK